jgi:hypothetical protein
VRWEQKPHRKASPHLALATKGFAPAGAPQSIPGPSGILVALVRLLARSAAKDELHIDVSNNGAGTPESPDGVPAPAAVHSNREGRDG